MKHGKVPRTALTRLPEQPLVSVLISSFNYSEYISDALESILGQTWQHLEAVVVDDGSTDRSVEVISRYARQDRRVRMVLQANGGHASTVNHGFAECRGQVVCLMDADDIFYSRKLELVTAAFKTIPPAGMVIHDMAVTDGEGNVLRLRRHHLEGDLRSQLGQLRVGHIFPTTSGLSFRREVLEAILPLDKEPNVDWALSYKGACLALVRTVPQALSGYRIHEGSMIGSTLMKDSLSIAPIRGMLEGMYVSLEASFDFAARHGVEIGSLPRPVLEHRLLLAILEGDRKAQRASLDDLTVAFRDHRGAYPRYRLVAWGILARSPAIIQRILLLASSRAFKGILWLRRLSRRNPRSHPPACDVGARYRV